MFFDYTDAIAFLKQSLIYQMSLGSKELFHSNVWYYLIKNEPTFIKVFFPDCEPSEMLHKDIVSREYHRRDLVIWYGNKKGDAYHLTIENKIKSIPSFEQLENYSSDIGIWSFKKGILTGIGEDILDLNTSSSLPNWRYLSYDIIAERIRNIAKSSQVKEIRDHILQIEEYCDVIDAINIILKEPINKNKTKLIYEDNEELKVLRILDVYKKLKGSHFLFEIRKQLTKELD